jgi:hypothetical protein
MSLRLRDLWAPAWSLTLTGRRYRMRPLSLGTFAALEGEGITLPSLSSKAPPLLWARLFILLAELEGEEANEERILTALMQDPIALRRFQHALTEALSDRQATARQATKRQVKNPLHDKREEEADSDEEFDATFLLMVARLSKLSLEDLSRMTFSGIMALNKWLEENPPQPGLFG